MRLPHGSTSFNVTTPGPGPKQFRTLITAVAREFGAHVEEFLLPDGTPNHVIARLRERERRFELRCHDSLFLLAFAEVSTTPGAPPVFRDEPRWAELLQARSEFRVYTKEELDTPLSRVDLSELNPVEHKQIRYWRPDTVGELTFNHWD
ncbi:hypothetical protein [Crossiella sp. CA198]|uniref:hypothetical protein n=1 Tax=Crossiella sp. CA198 TaxID=3455607 RepID=UPI003F8D7787